ncbi:hypothetical protein D9X30_3952 [Cupriavidus sp. U2]|nr:hypothetical protein D9X30_3952 [Cupriavidus sp. U2]
METEHDGMMCCHAVYFQHNPLKNGKVAGEAAKGWHPWKMAIAFVMTATYGYPSG